MVTLRRITEKNDSLLTMQSADPYTLWQQSKNKVSQTKLIPLSSLGLKDVRVRDPHSLDTLYINEGDATKIKDTIEEVREKQNDALTLLTIAREIDHSIEEPSAYKVDASGLFTKSQNDLMIFIPSYIAQGLKDLKKQLQDKGIRLNINIVSHNNQSLNKLYHIEASTKVSILKLSLKYNKKNYTNKDVTSIQDLKTFLIDAVSNNPEAVQIIKNFDFTKPMPKAQQARTVDGILYYSLASMANRAHKIGQLDFSYSNGKVNIVPTATVQYRYRFNDGELIEG